MPAERLFSRAVIRLSPEAEGEDVADFLQGLVTQDVAGQLPAWAGLLTPQGKTL
ncbi:MAG: folate-binding protein, partial [Croceibacterium sp.]